MRPLYPKWQVVGRALTKVLGQQYARAVPLSLSLSLFLWNTKGRVKLEQKTMDELFAQSELLVQLLELRIEMVWTVDGTSLSFQVWLSFIYWSSYDVLVFIFISLLRLDTLIIESAIVFPLRPGIQH